MDSVSRINGQMVNLSVLKGSRSTFGGYPWPAWEELMRPQLHITMLDEFRDATFPKAKMLIMIKPLKITNVCANKWWNQRNQQENKARIEMLEFQIAEIEGSCLGSG